ncbi:hypothetical protein ACH34R_26280 [Spongiactinospora sp. 9N601]
MFTAAFTGMRWGELAGLAAADCHLDDGYLRIDGSKGALHEVGGRVWRGPPKIRAAVRRIDLPSFLVDLLAEAVDVSGNEEQVVFSAPEGGVLRRSNFARRVWCPACGGHPAGATGTGMPASGEPAEEAVPPVVAGAVFHGLRHHHKAVLEELDVPEVLVCERMGHRMGGVQGRYSHVTEQMRRRLNSGLQRRYAGLAKTTRAGGRR